MPVVNKGAPAAKAPAAPKSPKSPAARSGKTAKAAKTAAAANKVPKVKKVKSAGDHPSYLEMVTQAIAVLKDRKGASRQAIYKQVATTHNLIGSPANEKNVRHRVSVALKKGTASGSLLQATKGRYKLTATPKTATPKTATPSEKKVTSAKKAAAKKMRVPTAYKAPRMQPSLRPVFRR